MSVTARQENVVQPVASGGLSRPLEARILELETALDAATRGLWRQDELDAAKWRARKRAEKLGVRDPPAWHPMATMPAQGQVIVCWSNDTFDTIGREEYLEIMGYGETPAKGWMPLPAPPGQAPPQETP